MKHRIKAVPKKNTKPKTRSRAITSRLKLKKQHAIHMALAVVLAIFGFYLASAAINSRNNVSAATNVRYNPYFSKCLPDPAKRPILKEGARYSKDPDTGYCVLALQRALNDCCGQGVLEDGWYGPKTKIAVVNFQNFFDNPKKDGVVDVSMWGGLDYIEAVAVKNTGAKYLTPQQVWDIAHRSALTTQNSATPAAGTATPVDPIQDSASLAVITQEITAPPIADPDPVSNPTTGATTIDYTPPTVQPVATSGESPSSTTSSDGSTTETATNETQTINQDLQSNEPIDVSPPSSITSTTVTPVITANPTVHILVDCRMVDGEIKAFPNEFFEGSTENGCKNKSTGTLVGCIEGYILTSSATAKIACKNTEVGGTKKLEDSDASSDGSGNSKEDPADKTLIKSAVDTLYTSIDCQPDTGKNATSILFAKPQLKGCVKYIDKDTKSNSPVKCFDAYTLYKWSPIDGIQYLCIKINGDN